ncbi:MAG: septal ring lytic transglycosylase RlpA family protein, partial [Candidatus Paceibacterota bacterium]
MAAHKELPFGTIVVLKNLTTGQEQAVVIYDRGPFHEDRDFDVSEAAAKKLGFKTNGIAELEATIIKFP